MLYGVSAYPNLVSDNPDVKNQARCEQSTHCVAILSNSEFQMFSQFSNPATALIQRVFSECNESSNRNDDSLDGLLDK